MLVWFGQRESKELGRVGCQRGNGVEGQIIKSLVCDWGTTGRF